MNITLGLWTAEMSVDEKQRTPLADAMGDQAWKTVETTAGFTPVKYDKAKPPKTGFVISGKVTNLLKDGSGMRVFAVFTILLDNSMVNVAPVKGDALAEGSARPEEALRAVTEARITKILGLISKGLIKKAA